MRCTAYGRAHLVEGQIIEVVEHEKRRVRSVEPVVWAKVGGVGVVLVVRPEMVGHVLRVLLGRACKEGSIVKKRFDTKNRERLAGFAILCKVVMRLGAEGTRSCGTPIRHVVFPVGSGMKVDRVAGA